MHFISFPSNFNLFNIERTLIKKMVDRRECFSKQNLCTSITILVVFKKSHNFVKFKW
jgi:hypothetical protein